jgi:uncharacterized repeat protein (TIGR03899 family)
MNKIQILSGQQRLRQLAKRQLGQDLQQKSANVAENTISIQQLRNSNQIHQQLAARAGALTDTSLPPDTLSSRADKRRQMTIERQQYNLEKVLSLAEEFCTDQPVSQEPDPDWFCHYCELVQNISALTMQKLWARILAMEIRTPGSFSYKTLNILCQMHYKDAQSLQLASSLCCRISAQEPAHIYFGYSQRGSLWQWLRGRNRGLLNLSQFGLTYPQILGLVDLGLLYPAEIESGVLSKHALLQWQFSQAQLNGKLKTNHIVLQYYKFTNNGAELLGLLNSPVQPLYLQALQQLFSPVIAFQ